MLGVLMDSATSSPNDAIPDLYVVSARPLGVHLVLASRARGLSVALLESDSGKPGPENAKLSEAELVDPRRSAGMDVGVCHAFGGASRWRGEALGCGTPVPILDQVGIWREIEAAGVDFVDPDTVDGTEAMLQQWLAIAEPAQARAAGAAKALFSRQIEVASTGPVLIERVGALL